MKRLSRYRVIDAYILEELCRKYRASDTKGRVDLLKQFWGSPYSTSEHLRPPFKVALMAVEDPNVEIRQWVARNALDLNFDFGEKESTAEEEPYSRHAGDGWPKANDRDLTRRLRDDPDVFVRACLHENPNLLDQLHWGAAFDSATHLERLALMRNRETASSVHRKFVEALFDPDDESLRLDPAQRRELVLAYISNRSAQWHSRMAQDWKRHSSRWRARVGSWPSAQVDGHVYWTEACEHFSKLWKLAPKWQPPIPFLMYYYFGLEDKARAEIYEQCGDDFLREVILESSDGRLHPKTIELGTKDKNKQILEAIGNNPSLKPDQIEALEAALLNLPDNDDKTWLMDDLYPRLERRNPDTTKIATSWPPFASSISSLAVATVILTCIAILGPALFGLGRLNWLLLTLLCALMLNACVIWRSSAVTANALRAGPSSDASPHLPRQRFRQD